MAKHREGPVKPAIIHDTHPIKAAAEAGKYFWCACGRSSNQPFCDGSHYQTGIRPLRVVLEKPEEVYWCACKCTATPPFCDGTHKQLKGQEGQEAKMK
ncbi:MAG: CDGSH iron-sulfur domain-containing protein [Lentimicrobiaceae bacterium]|nr:CDGSH iron-sulfur domain-containing protein [Lentimicrobiaceae bacterium]